MPNLKPKFPQEVLHSPYTFTIVPSAITRIRKLRARREQKWRHWLNKSKLNMANVGRTLVVEIKVARISKVLFPNLFWRLSCKEMPSRRRVVHGCTIYWIFRLELPFITRPLTRVFARNGKLSLAHIVHISIQIHLITKWRLPQTIWVE